MLTHVAMDSGVIPNVGARGGTSAPEKSPPRINTFHLSYISSFYKQPLKLKTTSKAIHAASKALAASKCAVQISCPLALQEVSAIHPLPLVSFITRKFRVVQSCVYYRMGEKFK